MKQHIRVYEVGDRLKVVGYRPHGGPRLNAQRDDGAALFLAVGRSDGREWGLEGDELDAYALHFAAAQLSEQGWARHTGKLDEARSRAKRRIFEGIACNPWDWFCTLTLDAVKVEPRGYGRGDLDAWRADLKSGFRDERNGVHLFSPCGCNPLRFWISRLSEEGAGYQKTYAV